MQPVELKPVEVSDWRQRQRTSCIIKYDNERRIPFQALELKTPRGDSAQRSRGGVPGPLYSRAGATSMRRSMTIPGASGDDMIRARFSPDLSDRSRRTTRD